MTLKLEQGRIVAGVWEGTLSGTVSDLPAIEASTGGRAIEGVTVVPVPGAAGRYAVKVPIPASALNEGVQTFLIRAGETVLGQFTLVAGEPLDGDLRAEISLLRAELDLLKRAFQRHVRES